MINIIIALCLLLSTSWARDAVEPSQTHTPQTYALLIGASSFQNITGLERPEARSLCAKATLVLYETIGTQHAIFACDPELASRANILALAGQINEQARPGDTVLVSYTGLGIGGDFDDPMLLTQDSAATTEQVGATSLKLDELVSALSKDGVTLVFFIDATLEKSVQLIDGEEMYSASTIGPTAIDVSGKHLALSYSSSAEHIPNDPVAFGELLAKGLKGDADLDKNGSITGAEINRYMVQELTAQTGQPPGVRGAWNEATSPIITLRPPIVDAPMPEKRPTWQYNLPIKARQATFIASGSTLILAGGSYVGARVFHHRLGDQAYSDRKGYEALVLGRNSLLIASQVALGLGIAGMGSASFTLARDDAGNLAFAVSLPW